MLRCLPLVALLPIACGPSVLAEESAEVRTPERIQVGDARLPLRGTGTRRKLGLRLYSASLFAGDAAADGPALLASDAAIAVRIEVRSPLFTKPRMRRMVDAAIGEVPQAVRSGMDHLFASLDEPVKRGDVVEFAYEPRQGTTLRHNGRAKGTVAGSDFRKVLFGIWIGHRAVDSRLAESLLTSSP